MSEYIRLLMDPAPFLYLPQSQQNQQANTYNTMTTRTPSTLNNPPPLMSLRFGLPPLMSLNLHQTPLPTAYRAPPSKSNFLYYHTTASYPHTTPTLVIRVRSDVVVCPTYWSPQYWQWRTYIMFLLSQDSLFWIGILCLVDVHLNVLVFIIDEHTKQLFLWQCVGRRVCGKIWKYWGSQFFLRHR